MFPNTFTISTQPFYDQYNQCYKNIVTTNIIPNGPLRYFIRQIQLPKLSPFQVEGPCNPIPKCAFAFVSLNNHNQYTCNKSGCNLMTPDDIPNLLSYLTSNGYQIETQLTNMLNFSDVKTTNNRLMFNVTYYGNQQPNITYMR